MIFEPAIRTLPRPIRDWLRDEPRTSLFGIWVGFSIKECGIFCFFRFVIYLIYPLYENGALLGIAALLTFILPNKFWVQNII